MANDFAFAYGGHEEPDGAGASAEGCWLTLTLTQFRPRNPPARRSHTLPFTPTRAARADRLSQEKTTLVPSKSKRNRTSSSPAFSMAARRWSRFSA